MPAVVSGSQNRKKEDTSQDFRSIDAGPHESSGANLPESGCDGIQTASINDPHIFFRAFVVKKSEVPTKGMEEAENVTDSVMGSQSTNATQRFQYDMKKLQKIFADIDKRLRSNKFSEFSRDYKKCPSRTLQEVETRSLQILQQGKKSSKKAEKGCKPGEIINSTAANDDDGCPGTKHIHPPTVHSDSDIVSTDTLSEQQHKKFLKTAKKLFTYFLPLEFDSALVAKYWGAVYVLMEVKVISPALGMLTPFLTYNAQDHHKFNDSPYNIFNSAADILVRLDTLTSEWTQGRAPSPWAMKIPDILGDAWLHLVMFFVLSLDNDNFLEADSELDYVITAVSRGRKEILQSLAPQPLRELEAVLPFGIASLVINNLVNHGVPGQPNVASTYSKYLDKLVRQTRCEIFMNSDTGR